jgi:hypothetical protein
VRGELLLLKALGLPPAALNVIALVVSCQELRAGTRACVWVPRWARSSWCCELGCDAGALLPAGECD